MSTPMAFHGIFGPEHTCLAIASEGETDADTWARAEAALAAAGDWAPPGSYVAALCRHALRPKAHCPDCRTVEAGR